MTYNSAIICILYILLYDISHTSTTTTTARNISNTNSWFLIVTCYTIHHYNMVVVVTLANARQTGVRIAAIERRRRSLDRRGS